MWITTKYKDEDLAVDETQFIVETEAPTEESAESESVYTDAETVKKVQTALNEAGYNCGPADGQAGNMTKAAIRQYQEANGLPVTGEITDSLLQSMGIA